MTNKTTEIVFAFLVLTIDKKKYIYIYIRDQSTLPGILMLRVLPDRISEILMAAVGEREKVISG